MTADMSAFPDGINEMHNDASVTVSTPARLIVRCFAELKGDQWQAFTVEFGLAAQADSLSDVKSKLEAMISCYLEDALVGEDRRFARKLLARKASLTVYLKYYLYVFLNKIGSSANNRTGKVFDEPMLLFPRACFP